MIISGYLTTPLPMKLLSQLGYDSMINLTSIYHHSLSLLPIDATGMEIHFLHNSKLFMVETFAYVRGCLSCYNWLQFLLGGGYQQGLAHDKLHVGDIVLSAAWRVPCHALCCWVTNSLEYAD